MGSSDVHPLIRQGRIMVMPGVYDVLSAKIAERAGFPAVVLTGYGVSASHLGEPDFGILAQTFGDKALPACGGRGGRGGEGGGFDGPESRGCRAVPLPSFEFCETGSRCEA